MGNLARATVCGTVWPPNLLIDIGCARCGLTVAAALSCALAVAWATYRPADAENFKVDSVAAWLNRDGHDQYSYITLGFGNKIARLAVLTDASSVDGEWNSGRMLPELTQYGAGALTSSKYFGKAGLDSLRAILHHADRYGLKWVFVRDPYYEPLLDFAGWRPVDTLEDKTITVWSKDGCSARQAYERAADPAALARPDVGHSPLRQQPSRDPACAHSRETVEPTARRPARHGPRKSRSREAGVMNGRFLAILIALQPLHSLSSALFGQSNQR